MKTLHLLVLSLLLLGCWGCASYNLPAGYSYLSFESGHYPTIYSYCDDKGDYHMNEFNISKTLVRDLAWSHWYSTRNKTWHKDVVVPVPLP